MTSANQLEESLNDIFGKKAPQLPANAKKLLVEYLPWITLIIGVLTLLATLSLWHWAHTTNDLLNYANSYRAAAGLSPVEQAHMSIGIWLGIIVLFVEAVLYVAAFRGLRARAKSGWDLLYYAALVNIAYGVLIMFTDYGSIGSLIGNLIGSAIGFYFLFQIRSSYTEKSVKPTEK